MIEYEQKLQTSLRSSIFHLSGFDTLVLPDHHKRISVNIVLVIGIEISNINGNN